MSKSYASAWNPTNVTEEDRELFIKGVVIANKLPHTYKNGFVQTEYVGYCACCGQPIEPTLLRGAIACGHRKIRVKAVGVCPECRVLTRFLHILHDDGTIVAPQEDGSYLVYAPKKSWWAGVRTKAIMLLHHFFGGGA